MEICGEIYRLSSDIYGTMFKEFEILEDQTSHKKSLPKLIQMNIFLDLMNGIGKFTVVIHLAYKANLHKKDSVNFIFRRCQCVSLKNKVILLNLKTFENEEGGGMPAVFHFTLSPGPIKTITKSPFQSERLS